MRETLIWLAVALATAFAVVVAVVATGQPAAGPSSEAVRDREPVIEEVVDAAAPGEGDDSDDEDGSDVGVEANADTDTEGAGDFRYIGPDTGDPADGNSANEAPIPYGRDEDLAPHEDGVVLASVPAGTTRDELQAMLADEDCVDASQVTDEELARGIVTLRITDGTPVAEASASLAAAPGIEAAQPNYLYTLAEDERSISADVESVDAGSTPVDFVDGDPVETPIEDLAPESVTPDDYCIVNKERGIWGLESLHAYDAWETAKCAEGKPVAGQSVAVAVIDTGCFTGHEDLDGNILATYDASNYGGVSDYVGHGTHVAGIISAEANNGLGTAGVSYNAGLVIVKASTKNTYNFSTATLTAAYDWVLDHAEDYNIRVINLSVGGEAGSKNDAALLQRIDTAYARGILTVAAAGNGDDDLAVPYACYPGDHETILSVMNLRQDADAAGDADATDDADATGDTDAATNAAPAVTLEESSNYNVDDTPIKDVCAPGTNILSTYSDIPTNGNWWQYNSNCKYGLKTGTSMATPYVAGVAALVLTANPRLTPQQVMNLIENTATDLGAPGWDRTYGHGEVDAAAAVRAARAGTDTQATQTTLTAISPQISGPATVSATSGSATYTLSVKDSGTTWSSFKSLTWTWTSSDESVGTIDATTTVDAPAVMTVRGVGTTTLTATCVAAPSIKATYTVTVQSAALDAARVTVADQTYTGAALTPEPTVTYGGRALVRDVDYTVAYADNVEVGMARVTVTGRGNYAGTLTTTFAIGRPALSVSYRTHVQKVGWQDWRSDGATAGTSGRALRLEGIYIQTSGAVGLSGTIEYRTHVQKIGWQDWRSAGQMAGTEGRALRLEAIQIRLTGDLAKLYDVYYRVHAQKVGWMDWAANGASAGTSGLAYRLEAIQIVLVPKGGAAPGATSTPYRSLHYRTHVQKVGWQSYTYEGQSAGTTGRALRLEAIDISLGDQYAQQGVSGGIRYRTHVQRIGWQGWRSDGAMAGTSGRALRLEAICIELTGDMAENYDVYYRVHAQHFGWMDWARNGAPAGTAGYAYRLEAIQIRIVPKGSAPPGSTSVAFRQRL